MNSIKRVPQSDPLFSIPEELWLHIFTLSTSTPRSHENRGSSYEPFAAVTMRAEDWSSEVQHRLATKRRLLLVCKAWKSIAVEVVYREIRARHGTGSLFKAVRSPEVGGDNARNAGYGSFVRHLEISPILLDTDPFNPIAIAEILACCPKVTSLARTYIVGAGNAPLGQIKFNPDSVGPSSITSFPTLTTLTRVDWWLSSSTSGRHKNNPSEVLRNLFLDLLGDIIHHAPNLQYLTLGSGPGFFAPPFRGNTKLSSTENPICLPRVETMRLELGVSAQYGLELFDAQTWEIPKLETLILGRHYLNCKSILKSCGTLIKTVEIMWEYGKNSGDATSNILQDLCKHCPELEELNFCHDQWDIANEDELGLEGSFKNLQTVRFELGRTVIARSCMTFLTDRRALPALRKIVVYGVNGEDEQKASIEEFRIALQARGVEVEGALKAENVTE